MTYMHAYAASAIMFKAAFPSCSMLVLDSWNVYSSTMLCISFTRDTTLWCRWETAITNTPFYIGGSVMTGGGRLGPLSCGKGKLQQNITQFMIYTFTYDLG